MNKNRRVGIIALTVAGLLGLGYFAYSANRAPAAAPAAPAGASGSKAKGGASVGSAVAVEVARIGASDFSDEASAVGTLKSNESVVLRPETPGRIAAINFRDGAIVNRGALLVALDAAVQEAELQQAKANLALAQNNNKRNQELLAQKFVSQRSVDETAANLEVAQAKVALAQATVDRLKVKAPFDGIAGIRQVNTGDYLKDGADIVNIEDIDAVYVDFRLPERFQAKVRKGQRAQVDLDALPGIPPRFSISGHLIRDTLAAMQAGDPLLR